MCFIPLHYCRENMPICESFTDKRDDTAGACSHRCWADRPRPPSVCFKSLVYKLVDACHLEFTTARMFTPFNYENLQAYYTEHC